MAALGDLSSIAQGIIGTLGPLAFKEIKQLCGVKDELEMLKNTVSAIQAVLLDADIAEDKRVGSYAVRDWLEKLEDAMYDADDLLDDFSTEALGDRRRREDGVAAGCGKRRLNLLLVVGGELRMESSLASFVKRRLLLVAGGE